MKTSRKIARPLPLLDWGEQHRATQDRRRRQCWFLFATGVPLGLLASTLFWQPPVRLVWNASASAPIGLYGITNAAHLAVGDMVAVHLGEPFRTFAASRHYLPANVLLIKRIAAGPGDEICALGSLVTINGNPVATRQARDGHGRPLPGWTGCQILGPDRLFLMMRNTPWSFDGRYFGATVRSAIVGKATPLWVR